MRTKVASADADAPVSLRTPSGKTLRATLHELTYESVDGELSEITAAFDVTAAVYKTVDRDALFHLAPGVRGPGSAGFAPGKSSVRIEARLDPALVDAMLGLGDDPWRASEQVVALASSDPASRLLDTESWFALDVTVEQGGVSDGELRTGYATTYADESPAGGLPRAVSMLVIAGEVAEQSGWEPREVAGDTALAWTVESPNGSWTCYALAREDRNYFVVYSTLDLKVPKTRLAVMAELLARLNHGLPIGNWELDWSNGSVRFKTSIDVEGDALSFALADRLVDRNVQTTHVQLPAVEAVARGKSSVDDAVRGVDA